MNQSRIKEISINLYSTIVKIDAAYQGKGYKNQSILEAKRYLDEIVSKSSNKLYLSKQQDEEMQSQLLDSLSKGDSFRDYLIDRLSNSREGMCVRCYISHFILQACQERFIRFSLGGKRFQLRDLLPLVLTDDGKPLTSSLTKKSFVPYSFQILQEYLRRQPSSRKGLNRWVLMKTKQNDAIEKFLLECGVCVDSDWGILNTTSLKQIERVFREFYLFSPNAIQHLSESEIQRAVAILHSFHEIYRGDRQKNHQYGPCQPPIDNQLQRMSEYLWANYQIKITSKRLIDEIKAIASRLRDYRICGQNIGFKCESFDALSSQTGRNVYEIIADPNSVDEPEQEAFEERKSWESELQFLLSQQLVSYLDKAIDTGFKDIINGLSRKCTHLAKDIKPAFYFLYCEKMSQSETASRLKLTQSQISRNIKPVLQKHPQQVRSRVQEQLLQLILNKVKGWGLVKNIEQLDYFNNLVEHLDLFIETKIFSSLDKKVDNQKNNHINSLYFQRVCIYLSKYKEIES